MGVLYGQKYPWHDDDIVLIRKLLLEGFSRSRIADELPVRNGIRPTRNAVIGKIARLDIPGFSDRSPRVSAPRKPRPDRRLAVGPKPSKPLPAEIAPPPVVREVARRPDEYVPSGRGAVLGLRHHECKYPFGDPRQPGFRFCCADRLEGRPYCAEHVKVSYVPLAPRPQRRPHRGRV